MHNFWAKLILLLSWAGFVFTIIAVPFPPRINAGQITFYDKGVHMVLFGIFAYLLIKVFEKQSRKNAYFLTAIISFLFALFGEYIQSFIPGRSPSEFDLLAGSFGIILAIIYEYLMTHKPKEKLLLHVCCIGCGGHVSSLLSQNFKVSLYFYNPNIFPEEEYVRRRDDARRIAKKLGLKIFIGDYDHDRWKKIIAGHENDMERGERCHICYNDRLEKTAVFAKENGYEYFSTTLTVSPFKDAAAVSIIGNDLADHYKLNFFDMDFKKNDGFKKSVAFAKCYNVYRQEYCGCEFSLKN